MRTNGPLLTLAAVGVVAAGVATTNVVLTAEPDPPAVEQATGALALGSPLPAPAPPAPAAPAGKVVYKGWSTNRAVSVDITVEDGSAKAYVCDAAEIESWTKGTVSQDGPTRLTADDGSWVEYTVQDGTATGTASAAGKTWDFTATAEPADPAPAPAPDPVDGDAPVGSGDSGGSGGSGGYGGGY